MCEDVTGSVAIKTVPNKKLPINKCCNGVIVNIAFVEKPDKRLKINAVNTKPRTELTIILQEAIPQ